MKRLCLIILLLCVSVSLADQNMAKSTGLTPIGELEDLEEVRQHLEEMQDTIDKIYRQIHGDIDQINRDEIPALEASIAAVEGGEIDFDIPLVRDLNFTWNAGTSKIDWDEGALEYKGTTYTISSGSSETNAIVVYIDIVSLTDPMTLGSDTTATIVFTQWPLCYREGTTVYPALQSPIIEGGYIKANSIAADKVVASTFVAVGGGAADVNAGATRVNPGQILISGSTYLSSWATGTELNGSVIDDQSVADGKLTTATVLKLNKASNAIDVAADSPISAYSVRVPVLPENTVSGKLSADTLCMGSDYLGFWDQSSSSWPVYMRNNGGTGEFFCGNATKYVSWNGTTLDVRGTLNATDIVAGTITLADGSTLPTVTGVVDFNGGDFVCDTLTAKESVQIGEDDGDNTFRITVDASEVATAICKRQTGADYYMTTFNKDGIQSYYNTTFTGMGSTSYRSSFLGGLGLTSAFSRILSARKGVEVYCDDATKANYYFLVDSNPVGGRFGISGGTRTITFDTGGVVTVPAHAITGGTAGASGTFEDNNGNTVRVINGIITDLTE